MLKDEELVRLCEDGPPEVRVTRETTFEKGSMGVVNENGERNESTVKESLRKEWMR